MSWSLNLQRARSAPLPNQTPACRGLVTYDCAGSGQARSRLWGGAGVGVVQLCAGIATAANSWDPLPRRGRGTHRICGAAAARSSAESSLPRRRGNEAHGFAAPAHFRPPLAARPAGARRGARAVDVPARAGGGGPLRSAGGGAAPVRARTRSRHADRRAAPGARRERQGRHHLRGGTCRAPASPIAQASRWPPTRRHCRCATPRSISWCRRWRCNSSTICPAR